MDSLRALPRMVDERKLAAMRILMLATPPAYFEDQNLLPLVSLRMVRLSVRYGNAAHSAFGYVMYGMVLCGVLGDMRRGLAFGRLALDAVDLFDARDIHGRVVMVRRIHPALEQPAGRHAAAFRRRRERRPRGG